MNDHLTPAERLIAAGGIFEKPSPDGNGNATHEPGAVERANPLGKLMWFDQIEADLDVADFVQGTLLAGCAAVVFGEPGCGKTFWATDLALHVAAGLWWNGRRVEQGGVIYCVLEGGQGFRNRVAGWKRRHSNLVGPVHFAARQSSVNLLDPDADTRELILTIKAAAKHICMPVKLIVIEVVAGDGPIRVARVLKQRDMRKGDEHPFTLEVVDLGVNRHGEAVTTCLVLPQEGGTGQKKTGKHLTEKQAGWLRDLEDLFAEPSKAQMRVPFEGSSLRLTVTRAEVREALRVRGRFIAEAHAGLTAIDRRRMSDMLNLLKDRGKIDMRADLLWFP